MLLEGMNTNFNSFFVQRLTQTVHFTDDVATQCQSDATDWVLQKKSVGVQADEYHIPKKKRISVMTEEVTIVGILPPTSAY